MSTITSTPLRQAREAKGWSQRRVARESGLTAAQVHTLESGQAAPTARTLFKAAVAVGLTDLADALRPYIPADPA